MFSLFNKKKMIKTGLGTVK